MRDAVMESVKAELARRDTYEANCPECAICGQKMTCNEYYYDMYGTYVCDEYECITRYLRQFRKTIVSYLEDR